MDMEVKQEAGGAVEERAEELAEERVHFTTRMVRYLLSQH
jgi:hypothetical protein